MLHRIQSVEEWVRGWGGEELLHPHAPDAQSTRRSQVLHVVEWHWGYGHGLLWLAQPRCLLLCTRLMAQYLSVTVLPASPPSPMALVARRVTGDVPVTPRALQVELPPPAPVPHSVHCGRKRDLRAEALTAVKGLAITSASAWMSLTVREGEKNPQNKFWKNPHQTIPVAGTAFSEIQMGYPFISATVLSCFINNRLVLESDKMGTSTVITHCSFCEDCHKNNCVFSLPPKTSSETNF